MHFIFTKCKFSYVIWSKLTNACYWRKINAWFCYILQDLGHDMYLSTPVCMHCSLSLKLLLCQNWNYVFQCSSHKQKNWLIFDSCYWRNINMIDADAPVWKTLWNEYHMKISCVDLTITKWKSLKEFYGEFWMTNGCMLNSPSIKHYGYIFVNIVNGEEFLCHCTPAQSMICN